MKTVIMAGGKGTRIKSLFPNIPKPLIPVNGKPLLEWEIKSLCEQGFNDIILTVSYMADKIQSYFGDGSRFGAHIEYFVEEQPLGNAGALFMINMKEDFLLCNADVMFDIDFNRFVEFHSKKGGLVTLYTHPNSHPYDSGLLITAEDGSVDTWLAKEDARPQYYKNRVNAGIHVISPKALAYSGIKVENINAENPVDLDRQILKPLCGTHKMFCYEGTEYIKDMGTPERYQMVSKDFANGIVSGKNLRNKQKAVFLDRDGTINQYVGFLRNQEEFQLLPEVEEAVKKLNESGYLSIVVTNQPVIARGEVTVNELELIHNKMETLLGMGGAYLDGIYYCPHHPHKGYEGEIKELKIECNCRKPKPGMLLEAAEDFNLDLKHCWMIGDGENDILAGKNAGCHTALIGEGDYGQDLTVESLNQFVDYLFEYK